MKNAFKSLASQVLELSPAERAKLAEQLLCSLEQGDTKMDAMWADEAEVRIDAFERGEIEAVSINDVFEKYDQN